VSDEISEGNFYIVFEHHVPSLFISVLSGTVPGPDTPQN
jgi:hypothetical protein